MASSQSQEIHRPQFIAASMIAIPLFYFGLLLLVGPIGYLSIHLLLAWTVAAVVSATVFGFDRRFVAQFSRAERLGLLAGNGLVALFVAIASFAVFSGV